MTPATFLSYPKRNLYLSTETDQITRLGKGPNALEVTQRLESWEANIDVTGHKSCVRIDIATKEMALHHRPIRLHLVPSLHPEGSLTLLSAGEKTLELPVSLLAPAHIHLHREISYATNSNDITCLVPLSNSPDNLNIRQLRRDIFNAMPDAEDNEDDTHIFTHYYAELMIHFHVLVFDYSKTSVEHCYHYPDIASVFETFAS